MSKEIQANIHSKAYSKADNIIKYLLNPDDETVTLTATEKRTFLLAKKIHGYRMKFSRKTDVAALLVTTEGITQRHAYNLINETEQIFGSVNKTHKEYERQFLLELSRKNLEIAFTERNSTKITKALLAHYKIAGLEEFIPDMPDFSKLEQHKYIINLPVNTLDFMKNMLKQGNVKLSDFIPTPKFDQTEDATEVKDEPS